MSSRVLVADAVQSMTLNKCSGVALPLGEASWQECEKRRLFSSSFSSSNFHGLCSITIWIIDLIIINCTSLVSWMNIASLNPDGQSDLVHQSILSWVVFGATFTNHVDNDHHSVSQPPLTFCSLKVSACENQRWWQFRWTASVDTEEYP